MEIGNDDGGVSASPTNDQDPTGHSFTYNLQHAVWSGSLPIILTLAEESLCASPPRSVHRLIPRHSYLHVALREEVLGLSEHAPLCPRERILAEEPPSDNERDGASSVEIGSKAVSEAGAGSVVDRDEMNEATFPLCWFEDEVSGTPLRWHLFIGVLYDLMTCKSKRLKRTSSARALQSALPWRIKVHFTSYHDDLLPLDTSAIQPNSNQQKKVTVKGTDELLGRMFRNSLKASLFMQFGSSKVPLSINKNSHEQLWASILDNNHVMYHEVNKNLQRGLMSPLVSQVDSSSRPMRAKSDSVVAPQLVPVRLLLNEEPARQRPVKHERIVETKSVTEILSLPDDHMEAPPFITLGDVLVEWLPGYFAINTTTKFAEAVSSGELKRSDVLIQGIELTNKMLQTALIDLWRGLCHPDQYLYIVAATQT
ncbi:hypothetical protein THAOC_02320 [Thalassiosira oceanica]|uniref:Autophagy protein 5 n=1 Tax=Thalassiosira oceanica TaxID=159749 RepID=K0TQF2_THAOC|nr:hypothetical protein THAOC_02320 [Thalassiosira oceanica]|eukprot:EJK75942.1 hypothetical protein THAOC_02320 [Thalassiosira oceanica]